MNLTGRQPYQKGQKPPPKPRKRMPKVSAKRAKHYLSDEGKDDLAYMDDVRRLPCIVCLEFGMVQQSPTQAHHPIHGRYSSRKAPDTSCIPLCEGHHQGLRDTNKVAVHQQPSKWKRLYGEDTGWIERTQDDVERLI